MLQRPPGATTPTKHYKHVNFHGNQIHRFSHLIEKKHIEHIQSNHSLFGDINECITVEQCLNVSALR